MFSNATKSKIKSTLPRQVFEVLFTLKHLGTKKISGYEFYVNHVVNKKGVEIGGPSNLFKTALPLYKSMQSLDGVNFSNSTVWEGKIKVGLTFNYIANKKGIQFISDGTNLSQIEDASYDFVLSSNCLEHIANPIKALNEWKRILKNNGALILVLPNKINNFDRYRPTTTSDHLLEDFNNHTTEHDLTHLEEIVNLHDLSLDLPAGNIENFKKRSLDNFNNRTLHHHVFDLSVIKMMVEFCGLEVVKENETDQDFFVLAIKNN